jgi:hypothetical protein
MDPIHTNTHERERVLNIHKTARERDIYISQPYTRGSSLRERERKKETDIHSLDRRT